MCWLNRASTSLALACAVDGSRRGSWPGLVTSRDPVAKPARQELCTKIRGTCWGVREQSIVPGQKVQGTAADNTGVQDADGLRAVQVASHDPPEVPVTGGFIDKE